MRETEEFPFDKSTGVFGFFLPFSCPRRSRFAAILSADTWVPDRGEADDDGRGHSGWWDGDRRPTTMTRIAGKKDLEKARKTVLSSLCHAFEGYDRINLLTFWQSVWLAGPASFEDLQGDSRLYEQ